MEKKKETSKEKKEEKEMSEIHKKFSSKFDIRDVTALMELIEKEKWCWEYKWELMKKLVNYCGHEMFNLETELALEEMNKKYRKKKK